MNREAVGAYWLERPLAGTVFLAEHRLRPQPAVVKLVPPSAVPDYPRVRRWFRDARAAATVARGVVDVFDFGFRCDGSAFVVMERLTGETLAAHLRREPLALPHAIAIGGQLARTLLATHAAGLVHGALRSDRIFLTTSPSGRPRTKLLDFGRARLAPTPPTAADDLHALGTILSLTIHGAPPAVHLLIDRLLARDPTALPAAALG